MPGWLSGVFIVDKKIGFLGRLLQIGALEPAGRE